MKYLGWDSDFIIDGKLHLKGDYIITATDLINGRLNDNHTNLNIVDSLEVISAPTQHELIFRYNSKCWIYHADMTIFMSNRCYTKWEYREERLKKLLE